MIFVRFLSLVVLCMLLFPFPLYAIGGDPPAVPVTLVHVEVLSVAEENVEEGRRDDQDVSVAISPVSESMSNKEYGLVVLELFSSQACTFCPKADALMAKFIDRPDIIALSCHVDAFDTMKGSLALPICSTRHSAYEMAMNAGPKYTPQIVVNGRYEAVGHVDFGVYDALDKASAYPLLPATILPAENGLFSLLLPQVRDGEYKIWILVYDTPHRLIANNGENKGKEMTYYNVVSNAGFLGDWNGKSKSLKFDAKLAEGSKGFAIIAQDALNHYIISAARYIK